MDWRHRAACRDEDPELFFPTGTAGPALLQIEEAKSVCGRCEVTDECLQWALEKSENAGVWGGKDEEERRKEQLKLRAVKPPAAQAVTPPVRRPGRPRVRA